MATKSTKTAAATVHNGGIVATAPAIANTRRIYTPEELKTLMEAINIAPSWMSKRFIMQELIGWSEEQIARNAQLRMEEDRKYQQGDKVGGYR